MVVMERTKVMKVKTEGDISDGGRNTLDDVRTG